MEPSNVKALCSMVWVLAHMKKYEDALPYCDKAIQIAPGYAYALSYKGKLLLELKKYEEALTYYNRALEIQPDNQTTIYHKNKIKLRELKSGCAEYTPKQCIFSKKILFALQIEPCWTDVQTSATVLSGGGLGKHFVKLNESIRGFFYNILNSH